MSRLYCDPITYISKLIILCFSSSEQTCVKYSWKHSCVLDKYLDCVTSYSKDQDRDLYYSSLLKY